MLDQNPLEWDDKQRLDEERNDLKYMVISSIS